MDDTAMDLQALGEELNRLLAMETRGLARHLDQATPYLSADTYSVWHEVRQMLSTNADHAARISGLLASLELPERPFPFDPAVANFHYTDLACLLPVLIDEQRARVTAYQRAIEHCGADAKAADTSAALQGLLDDNQTQLDRLEAHHRRIAGGSALAERG